MLWASTTSKRRRASSADTLHSARMKKPAYPRRYATRPGGRLLARGGVDPDAARADAKLGAGAQAHELDLVAALGQRSRLALDPRVHVEVRVVDHADAQGRAPPGAVEHRERGHRQAAAETSGTARVTGVPPWRSECSALSMARTIARPNSAVQRGSEPVAIARAKSSQLQRERLGGLDPRDDDVAAAVGQLVLAEGRGRRLEVHAVVVDADRLVRGGVVIGHHALAARHQHVAHLARREPRDLDVRGGAALEQEREERGLGHVGLEHGAGRGGDLHDLLLEPVAQDREVVRREVADHAVGLVLAEVHPRRGDEVDLAELVLLDQLADLVDGRAVEERVARHQHEPALLGQLDELDRVVGRRGQRLLDQHVLAGLQRALGDRIVRAGRSGDDHRVDVVAREHVVEVARDGHAGSAVAGLGGPAAVALAQPP